MMTESPTEDLTFDRLINGLGGSSDKASSEESKADAAEDGDDAKKSGEPAEGATPDEEAVRLDRARRQAAPTVPVRPKSGEGSAKS